MACPGLTPLSHLTGGIECLYSARDRDWASRLLDQG
jgi:hypothetical protein